MDSQDIEKRLDRIEEKLDDLSKAMIDLVRFDQKLTATIVSVTDMQQRMSSIESKLNKVEVRCATRESAVEKVNELYSKKDSGLIAGETTRVNLEWVDKIIWLVIGSLAAIFGRVLLDKLF